jgi:hypothetical protein
VSAKNKAQKNKKLLFVVQKTSITKTTIIVKQRSKHFLRVKTILIGLFIQLITITYFLGAKQNGTN